jgi:hypothetical protein
MNFSQALDRIKWGQPMSREAWGDKRTYVYRRNPPDDDALFLRESAGSESLWSPSAEDVLATDWIDVPRVY